MLSVRFQDGIPGRVLKLCDFQKPAFVRDRCPMPVQFDPVCQPTNAANLHQPREPPPVMRQAPVLLFHQVYPTSLPTSSGILLQNDKPVKAREPLPVRSPPPVAQQGRWNHRDDEALLALIEARGLPSSSREWVRLVKRMPGQRTVRQCRARWKERLAPGLRHGAWSPEEDELLLATQAQLGNAWSSMLSLFPGRPYASLKNRCSDLLSHLQVARKSSI